LFLNGNQLTSVPAEIGQNFEIRESASSVLRQITKRELARMHTRDGASHAARVRGVQLESINGCVS
jgi:hypothetical protein